jgi:hypothetical protein
VGTLFSVFSRQSGHSYALRRPFQKYSGFEV